MAEVKFCHLYVMGYDRAGPLKIGRAVKPEERRRELQTGGHRHLHLYFTHMCGPPTASELELMAHSTLADRRLSGEWFDVPVETAICAIWSAVDAFQRGLPLAAVAELRRT